MLSLQRALLLASDDKEASRLQEILQGNGTLLRVANLTEAQARLREDAYSALFCAWSSYLVYGPALKEIRLRYPGMHVIVLPRAHTWHQKGFGDAPHTENSSADRQR